MVYCGKPSKGCASCRFKRTKVGYLTYLLSTDKCCKFVLIGVLQCDTLRPSCTQCIRAGRVCTGYRDPLSLSFRDQSQKFSGNRLQRVSSEPDSMMIDFELPRQTHAASELDLLDIDWFALTPPRALSVPIESQAMCYFFRNYVCEESRPSTGYFDYLPSIIGNNVAVGSALIDAVISLGMVGLSNAKHASEIMIPAKERYSLALQATNSSLRDEEHAKADQTLITVMLLGLYEVSSATKQCSRPY